MLIGVTHFFRDEKAFEQLAKQVIPEMIARIPPEEQIRVWVAGCASGEEAYSVAILLAEQSEAAGRSGDFVVLATDAHEDSVATASRGIFTEDAIKGVSPERLQRFFVEAPGGYGVTESLRRHVVFTRHDLLRNAPFTKLDLITCRNVLIYLEPQAQQRVLSFFHFGLKHKGYLWLGPSEVLAEYQQEFDTINSRWRIFQKRRNVQLPLDLRFAKTLRDSVSNPLSQRNVPQKREREQLALFSHLLTEHMPPSVLIDESRTVLHTFGEIESLLKLRKGHFSADVLELVNEELKVPLSAAIQRVLRQKQTVQYHNVPSKQERPRFFNLTVTPIKLGDSKAIRLLIKLEPRQSSGIGADTDSTEFDLAAVSNERMETLENELRHSQQDLQVSNEELEASNEELQASNEELHASNEELQSTNEELQSVNEELHTVNIEYQRRIDELTLLTNDMDHLLESTTVAMILLDANLKIRKWTPLLKDMLGAEPDHIGESIQQLARDLAIPRLEEDVQAVVTGGEVSDHEIEGPSGADLLLRVLPYRVDKQIDGVIITIFDVSVLAQTREELREAIGRRDRFLAMLSHELRNPLGAILNAAELIRTGDGTNHDNRDRSINTIYRQVTQMGRLLDDLLDVSRITSQKLQLRNQPLNLTAALQDWAESAGYLTQEVTFEVDIPAEKLVVDGDAVRLQQMVMNLLSNATRYTPKGGHVKLSLRSDNGQAHISVQDNGIGIKPADQKRIFELFVQADRLEQSSMSGLESDCYWSVPSRNCTADR